MCNISLFLKVSLEMIGSSIRCFQSSLTTSVPGNIYTTLQSGKYKAQIGSTADNLDEQHVCFYCLMVLCKGACAMSSCVQINWKYSKSIHSWIARSSSKKNILEGSTGLLIKEQISVFTSCLYLVQRSKSQRC